MAEAAARRFLAGRWMNGRWMNGRHALTVTGVVLAVAAFAQAIASVTVDQTTRAHSAGAVRHAITVTQGGTPLSDSGSAVLYAVPLCLLALAATVPLIFLRPPAAAVFITTASVLSLAAFGLVTVNNTTPGWVTAGGVAAQLIAIFRLGAAGTGTGRYLALALGVPLLILALAGRGGLAGVLLAAAVPLAAGAGIAVRSGRVASREDVARTELAETLVEHMARGERARIARELHDVVAHHISMISVQAETARLTTPGLPPPGAERFREIGDTARAGLTEMRRLLGVLRPDVSADSVGERAPQPGLAQIAALVASARVQPGGQVRLIVSGPVTSFDPGVELAAYRITQEALTNARRHAPGAAVDVELRYEQDSLRLRIRDNGPGLSLSAGPEPGPDAEVAGHGLLGMRERAATVGGKLRTGEAPGGGFLVEAALPVNREGA